MKRLMKRSLALLLMIMICICSVSCDAIVGWSIDRHAVALSDESPQLNGYRDYSEDGEYKVFVEKISLFSAKLTDKLVKKYGQDENIVISPLSVYMALALAAECSVGETRQEILDAVGVTYDEVNKFTQKLYCFANVEYSQLNIFDKSQTVASQQLTNSIWLDDRVSFIQSGVEKLASEYYCDVYQASFENGEAEKLINRYIENKSKGLLKGDIQFSSETYFVLMNTYYLKEIWNEYGDSLDFTSEKYYFQNSDGTTEHTKLLQGYYSEGKAYEGEGFTSFFTSTEHGFTLYFIVPDADESVLSVFNGENISTLLSLSDWGYIDDENCQLHYTRALFPEYEASFSEDIKGVLAEDFGINKLFDPDLCDMSNVTAESVYCDGVIHKAALNVDKKGIEGAAVTVMPTCGAAAPPEYETVYHDFTVASAFGFVLTDQYGTVVFSGIINTIE